MNDENKPKKQNSGAGAVDSSHKAKEQPPLP
jgi:hypothetical protein